MVSLDVERPQISRAVSVLFVRLHVRTPLHAGVFQLLSVFT